MSNYPAMGELKSAIGVDTSKFAKTVDSANLKSDVGKLDTDKLKNVPINLRKLKTKVGKLDVDNFILVPERCSKK